MLRIVTIGNQLRLPVKTKRHLRFQNECNNYATVPFTYCGVFKSKFCFAIIFQMLMSDHTLEVLKIREYVHKDFISFKPGVWTQGNAAIPPFGILTKSLEYTN